MSTLTLRSSERPPQVHIPMPMAPKPEAHPSSGSGRPAGERSFAQVLARLGEESARGEAQVSRALHASANGRDLSGSELLALQAGVYRYGEVVDLASRLVDRAATGVKTVIQGQ